MPCTETRIFDYSLTYLNTHKETLDAYIDYVNQLCDNLRENKRNFCYGCSHYIKQWIPKKIKLRQFGYGIGHICNSDCVYCARKISERGERMSRSIMRWQDEFNHIDFFEEFKNLQLYDERVTEIFIGTGEITVHPQKIQILKAINDMAVIIASNCFIYDEQIAQLIAKPRNYLFVSLDAGTPETYMKIKNRDNFGKTLNNLRLYKQQGGNIYLKYIVLDSNISESDLMGFIKIAEEIQPMAVDINIDTFLDRNKISDKMNIFSKTLAEYLDKLNIPYTRYF